jgi:hypothetical protein
MRVNGFLCEEKRVLPPRPIRAHIAQEDGDLYGSIGDLYG